VNASREAHCLAAYQGRSLLGMYLELLLNLVQVQISPHEFSVRRLGRWVSPVDTCVS